MSRKFSLAYLTLPGVSALEQEIAARAGYDYVSLRTIPMGQEGEPVNCLEKDPELFQKIKNSLAFNNMKLLDIELVRIKEDMVTDYRGAFEKGAELGATQVLSSVWTEDRSFAIDAYDQICEQARAYGLTINFEFPAISGVKTLKDALDLQKKVGAPNLKILMDMLYCYWDGETAEDIKAVDPNLFGVIHLCDCPKNYQSLEKTEIMRGKREYCGQGEVSLGEILRALPANDCSIELPNLEYIKEFGRLGHATKCLQAAKSVFQAANL